MKFLRDVLIVARNELTDAVRSRRAVLVLVLYLAGAMLACNGFISALHKIEVELCKMLALPASTMPGSVMNTLWKSEPFRRMMRELIHDREVVAQLVTVHPMAIVYGWLIFTFTPVLVILTAAPRISEELGSGSIRFALLRTSRAAWCIGKYVGQALMIVVALTLCALGAWCLSKFRLMGMNDLSVAWGMVVYSWKAWLYSLAFLGLALGVSQVTRSQNKAMAMGFAAWIGVSALGLMANQFAGEGWKQIWHAVRVLVPLGHRLDLWRMDAAHVVQSALFLLTLGFAYLFAGHAWLARKDL